MNFKSDIVIVGSGIAGVSAAFPLIEAGLKVLMLGGIKTFIDGREFHPHEMMVYKGMMFGNVPNFSLIIGYSNASWTLKSDLSSHYICRLLNYMSSKGYQTVSPNPTGAEVDDGNIMGLNSAYVKRAESIVPRQGRHPPWRAFFSCSI